MTLVNELRGRFNAPFFIGLFRQIRPKLQAIFGLYKVNLAQAKFSKNANE
jgi:hypothetical protein